MCHSCAIIMTCTCKGLCECLHFSCVHFFLLMNYYYKKSCLDTGYRSGHHPGWMQVVCQCTVCGLLLPLLRRTSKWTGMSLRVTWVLQCSRGLNSETLGLQDALTEFRRRKLGRKSTRLSLIGIYWVPRRKRVEMHISVCPY